MKELDPYRRYMKQLPEAIREAEIEAEKEVSVSASVQFTTRNTVESDIEARSGEGLSDSTRLDSAALPHPVPLCELLGMSYRELTEGYVRASGERTGMVYTQKLTQDPEEVLMQALDNSQYSECTQRERMNAGEEISDMVREEEEQAASSVEVEETARRIAGELEDMAGEETGGYVEVSQVIRTISVVNSRGVDETASSSHALAEAGLYGMDWYFSAPSLSELSAKGERGRIERRRQVLALPEIPFVPGTFRVLLDQSVTANIFMHAWRLFSGEVYVSGSTAYHGMLGQRIMPECVTISDQPVTKYSAFRCRIDCEGSPCRETRLVDRGIFAGLMHNLASADAIGERTTGNGGRRTVLSGNIHTDMRVMPANLVMEPGEYSFDELLAMLEDGVYVDQSLDVHHSLEIASGSFTIPCTGVLVKDGKMAGRAAGLTMTGNLREIFGGILALGNEMEFRPFDLYQSYVLAGPAILTEAVRIAG